MCKPISLTLFALVALGANHPAAAREGLSPSVRTTTPHIRVIKTSYASDLSSVLGSRGPLSSLGPVGDNPWNASSMARTLPDWSRTSDALANAGGPKSELGPGSKQYGPVGDAYTKFPKQYRITGEDGAGGPAGLLGWLSLVGGGGPNGVHGFATDENGNYVHDGKIQRFFSVRWDRNAKKAYPLHEFYSATYAAKHPELLDTSFTTRGDLRGFIHSREANRFTITNPERQYIHVAVVPEFDLDRFVLKVRDARGKVLATADRARPGLLLYADKGARLRFEVGLDSTGHYLDHHPYRMTVVGATRALSDRELTE